MTNSLNIAKKMRFFALILFLSSCQKLTKNIEDTLTINIKYKNGEEIAKVGDISLSLEELNEDFAARQGSFKGAAHLNTPQKKMDFVETQATQEAMFQEAIALGYFNDAGLLRDIKKLTIQKLMRDKLADSANVAPPTEEEMKKHYESNINLYSRKEAVKVSFLEIPFGTDKSRAKTLASNIYNDAKKTVKYGNAKELAGLASKHLQADKNSGMAQVSVQFSNFLEEEAFNNKFGKDSFKGVNNLKDIGDIYPLQEGPNSFFVIMKTGARKELNESFADAQEKIKKRLAFENRNKNYENYVKTLHEKYRITIHKEKVSELGKNFPEPKDHKNSELAVSGQDEMVD